MTEWYDWCGYFGVFLILLLFLLLQAEKLKSNGWVYQSMNVVGALGIMMSLVFGTFNLPAFLQELAWVLIGFYGMISNQKRRKKADIRESA